MACKNKKIELYRQAFEAADTSGDGKLSIQEFMKLLRGNGCQLSDAKIAETFLFFSTGEDDKNSITFSEFCKGLETLEKFHRELAKLFKELDTDGSGFLDRNELRKLLKMSGMQFSDDDLSCILNQADKNRDNQISFEEFVEAVS